MAKIPDPKDIAMEILRILLDDGMRPGTVMMMPGLHQRLGLTRPGNELQSGLDYAVTQGWVTVENDGLFVKFTDLGFAKA